MRVLVVDDDDAILRSTRLVLSELGHEAHECSDAAEIVDAAEALRPEVILLDARMPGLDLAAAVSRVRPTGARILLFTAALDAAELARDLGVALLAKPFRPSALEDALAGSGAMGPTAFRTGAPHGTATS